MVRVLLINPQRNLINPDKQFLSPPIGIAGLASFLEINNCVVELIDTIGEQPNYRELKSNGVYKCGMPNDKVYKIIEQFKPDIVGISCSFTPRLNNVLEIARLVKQHNKDTYVIVGGMHATTCAESVLKEPTVDYVIMGEAEIPMLNFINKIFKKETDFNTLQAFSYRTNNGFFVSKERVLVDQLDAFPLPAYHLLPMENYFKYGISRDSLTEERRQTSIITSRGCPFNCSFCSSRAMWGGQWRFRSIPHILNEISMLINLYGVKEIAFEDDNISMQPNRLEVLCQEIIHRNFNIKWTTPNGIHIGTLNEHLLEWMKRSGCRRLNFGIESGDDNILKNVMNKQLDLVKTKEMIKIAHDKGIVTLGYFVLGMPGETEDSLRRTIDYAKSIALDEIGLFIATPFPETILEKTCKENKYLLEDYTSLVAEDSIENQILFETPMLSREKLLYYKQLFFKEFYKQKITENPLYYCKRVLRHPTLVRKLWKK